MAGLAAKSQPPGGREAVWVRFYRRDDLELGVIFSISWVSSEELPREAAPIEIKARLVSRDQSPILNGHGGTSYYAGEPTRRANR